MNHHAQPIIHPAWPGSGRASARQRLAVCIAAAALLLTLGSASAAHLQVDVADFTATAATNRLVTLTPLPAARTNNTALLLREPRSTVTDANGSAWFSNVVAGSYSLSLTGAPQTTFTVTVPSTNGLISAADYLSSLVTDTGANAGWTRTQADARYASKGDLAGGFLRAGKAVILNPTTGTATEYTSLSNAFRSVANGQTLFIGPGTWTVSAGLWGALSNGVAGSFGVSNMPLVFSYKTNITVIGNGPSTVILATNYGSVIGFTMCSNLVFRDFSMRYSDWRMVTNLITGWNITGAVGYSTNFSIAGAIHGVTNNHRVAIERVDFEDIPNQAITGNFHLYGLRVLNCSFKNVGHYMGAADYSWDGTCVSSVAADLLIENCRTEGTIWHFFEADGSPYMNLPRPVTITNVVVRNNSIKGLLGAAFTIWSDEHRWYRDCVFSGNIVQHEPDPYFGWQWNQSINSAGNITNLIISGNIFEDQNAGAVWIYNTRGLSAGVLIENNIFRRRQADNRYPMIDAVGTYPTAGLVVRNNHFIVAGAVDDGIRISNACDVVISGNSGTWVDGAHKFISLSGRTTNTLILDNQLAPDASGFIGPPLALANDHNYGVRFRGDFTGTLWDGDEHFFGPFSAPSNLVIEVSHPGNPNGVIYASPGSIYKRTDANAPNDYSYTKTTEAGSALGWITNGSGTATVGTDLTLASLTVTNSLVATNASLYTASPLWIGSAKIGNGPYGRGLQFFPSATTPVLSLLDYTNKTVMIGSLGRVGYHQCNIDSVTDGLNVLDLADDCSYVKITGAPTGPFTLNGIASSVEDQFLILENATGQTMMIVDEDLNVEVGELRIRTLTGGNLYTVSGTVSMFVYDSSGLRWKVISLGTGASGGGGSGASFQVAAAPLTNVANLSSNLYVGAFTGNGATLTNLLGNDATGAAGTNWVLQQLSANGVHIYSSGVTNTGNLAGRTNNWQGLAVPYATTVTNAISGLTSGSYIRQMVSTQTFTRVEAGPVSVDAWLSVTGSGNPNSITIGPELYLYDTVSNTLFHEFTAPPAITLTSADSVPANHPWSVSVTSLTHTNPFKLVISWKVTGTSPNSSRVLNFVSGGSYDAHATFVQSIASANVAAATTAEYVSTGLLTNLVYGTNVASTGASAGQLLTATATGAAWSNAPASGASALGCLNLPVQSAKLPTSSAMFIDASGGHYALIASNNTSCQWQFVCPRDYLTNTLGLLVLWSAESGATNSVSFEASVMAQKVTTAASVETPSFDTAVTNSCNTPGTLGYTASQLITLGTTNDTAQAGDFVRLNLRVSRPNGDTNRFKIIAAELQYTR